MTKDKIEQRLMELQKALEQCVANQNMLMGGIAECRYWLTLLTVPVDAGTSD